MVVIMVVIVVMYTGYFGGEGGRCGERGEKGEMVESSSTSFLLSTSPVNKLMLFVHFMSCELIFFIQMNEMNEPFKKIIDTLYSFGTECSSILQAILFLSFMCIWHYVEKEVLLCE